MGWPTMTFHVHDRLEAATDAGDAVGAECDWLLRCWTPTDGRHGRLCQDDDLGNEPCFFPYEQQHFKRGFHRFPKNRQVSRRVTTMPCSTRHRTLLSWRSSCGVKLRLVEVARSCWDLAKLCQSCSTTDCEKANQFLDWNQNLEICWKSAENPQQSPTILESSWIPWVVGVGESHPLRMAAAERVEEFSSLDLSRCAWAAAVLEVLRPVMPSECWGSLPPKLWNDGQWVTLPKSPDFRLVNYYRKIVIAIFHGATCCISFHTHVGFIQCSRISCFSSSDMILMCW